MSKFAAVAGSNTVFMAGAVVVAAGIAVAGYVIGTQSDTSDPAVVQAALPVATPAPATDQTAEQTEVAPEESAATPVEDVAAAASEKAPSIDEVRLESDGLAVVAGRAEPGSKVVIVLDGEEEIETEADASGGFAAVTFIEPKNDVQSLTVVQKTGEDEIASKDEILLAPIKVAPKTQEVDVADAAAPEVVKEAEEQVASLSEEIVEEATPPVQAPAVEVAEPADAQPVQDAPQETARVLDEAAETVAEDIAEAAEDVAQAAEDVAVATEEATPVVEDVAEAVENTTTPVTETETTEVATAEDTQAPDAPQTEVAEVQETVETPQAEATETEVVAAADPVKEPAPTTETAAITEDETETTEVARVATEGVEATTEVAAAEETTETATEETGTTVAILRNSEDGVEVLNPAGDATESVVIDAITYSEEGSVALAGRAQDASGTVRVYLDNQPITDITVDGAGRWSGQLPDVESGVYTLRIDEINVSGAVTSRIETPFLREDPAILARAERASAVAKQITVQTGNTLWAIARDRYGEGLAYVQVFEANRDQIRDPDLIYPGQVFQLPD